MQLDFAIAPDMKAQLIKKLHMSTNAWLKNANILKDTMIMHGRKKMNTKTRKRGD